MPRIGPAEGGDIQLSEDAEKSGNGPPETFSKLRVAFAKEGDARFFGHLEMVNIFIRALRRAAVPVQYSMGFHPMPKIAFADPLPIGLESRCESFELTASTAVHPEDLVIRLNAQLPDGLRILGCEPAPGAKKGRQDESRIDRYRVTPPPDVVLSADPIQAFSERDAWIVARTNRKGKLKKIDLKDMIREMNLNEEGQLLLSLETAPGKTVRPAEVLREVFRLPEEAIKQSRMVKTA
jgi:radical SAM-linked protein